MVYVVDSGEDQPPYNSLRRKNIPTLTTPAEDLNKPNRSSGNDKCKIL